MFDDRRESPRPRVQNVLLGLGALLLATAGVIFVVVAWQRGGVAGRAVTLAVSSVLAVAGCVVAVRRGMPATGEALGAVAVVLAVLDAYALRRWILGGLPGAPSVTSATYWTEAFAVIAGLAVVGAMLVPLRVFRLAAAALGQLPLLIVAGRVGGESRWPAFAVGLTLGVQAAGLVALAAALRRRAAVRDARYVLAASAVVTWLVALAAALVAAYADAGGGPLAGVAFLLGSDTGSGSLAGMALLVGLGLVGVLAAWLGRDIPPVRHGACAAATAAVLLAAWTPAQVGLEARWLRPAMAGLGLAGMLLAFVLRRRWRSGPVAVCAAATLLAGLAAVEPVALAVSGAVGWLVLPWTFRGTGTAGDALAVGLRWESGVELPALLAAVAAGAAVAGRVAGRTAAHRRAGDAGAVAVLAAGLATAPLVAGFPHPVAVGWDMAIAAAGLAMGLGPATRHPVRVRRTAADAVVHPAAVGAGRAVGLGTGSTQPVPPIDQPEVAARAVVAVRRTAAGAGAVLAATALCWSLATPAVSVGAFGAALVGLLVVLWFSARLRHPAATALAVTLAAVETAAVARTAGAGAVLCGLAIACLGAVVVAGAGLLRSGGWSSAAPAPAGHELSALAAGAVVYLFGTAVAAGDPRQLWLALLVGAAGCGLAAVRPDRRPAGWVAGLLAAGSSWVRLAMAQVSAPEAYTAPLGAALVVVGYLRRRTDRNLPSWPAYGMGLSLILVPSLLRAATDAGLARPLILGGVALTVLLAGAARRLQAPLILGGAALAADGLVQLSPYLAATYAAMPRWVTIGAAGLLLLGAGATYERRLGQLRRLRTTIGRLT